MRTGGLVLGTESLNDEALDLLLDEAERALLDVEARSDEPSRRVCVRNGDPHGVAELKLAVAELVDAYPGVHYELESVSERLRNVGVQAATAALQSRPHILHLVRLSLESFFRVYPTKDDYEEECRDDETIDDEGLSATEVYETYQRMLGLLRRQTS